jgi:hypothetical protein
LEAFARARAFSSRKSSLRLRKQLGTDLVSTASVYE